MKHKALMLYPEIPLTYWSFRYAVEFEGCKSAFPPLGALTIASFFPRDKWEIKLVDQNVSTLNDREIQNADYIFISAMSVQKKSVAQDIERAHRYQKPTILGGPYVSTREPETMKADHRVEGEAESIMPILLEDLIRGTAKDHYIAPERPSLDKTPLPDLSLMNMHNYSSMLVQFSRGCPFDCEFCDITKIYGRKSRVKPTPAFLKELDQLYERGWRGSVFIVDDNFIGNLKEVREMLPKLIEWQRKRKYPFYLFTEASMNLAQDDSVLEKMVCAGFRKVFLGIETPVVESLLEANKKQNLRGSLTDSIKKIQQKGLQVMAGFIVGFDKDPKNIFEIQKRFITESGIPLAMAGLLSAIPGTNLYKRLKNEGRIVDHFTGNNTDGELTFIPKMDQEFLKHGYRSLMASLYSSKEYYQRALTYLKRARETAPIGSVNFSWKKTKAFAHSLLKQGVIDRDRWDYWKYLVRAGLINPRRFEEAVTLAVMGYHLRKVNELYFPQETMG